TIRVCGHRVLKIGFSSRWPATNRPSCSIDAALMRHCAARVTGSRSARRSLPAAQTPHGAACAADSVARQLAIHLVGASEQPATAALLGCLHKYCYIFVS